MSGLSDKYRKAVDNREISPDFKERTAAKMAMLRDSGNAVSDGGITVNISENDISSARRRRAVLLRTLSAAAAAAACLTVGFAINKAGISDQGEGKLAETDMPAAETTAAEETVIAETFPETGTAGTEAPADDTAGGLLFDETFDDEDIGGIVIEEPAEAVEETPEAETTAAVTEAETTAASETAAEPPAPTPEPAADTTPPTDDKNAPAGGAVFSIGNEEPDEAPPPMYDEVMEEAEEEYEEEEELLLEPYDDDEAGEGFDDDGDFEEEPAGSIPDEYVSVSESAEAEKFSAKKAVSAFKAQNSEVIIIPNFEDVNELDGSVTTYQSKKIRSVKTLLELNKELYAYAEDGKASVLSSAPTDSRYIIDYSDKSGNAMRIYVGSRYICYAKDGNYYSFELTEENYNKLDKALYEHIY